MTASESSPRLVFLIRCWKESAAQSEGGEGEWRFVVEEVYPQKHWQGFDSLEKLFAFLQDVLSGEEKV